ncbi:MAG TPA: HEAT repeat domain-containing protein [Mycobacteriales bacterium]|nr:HEAT repeat domain-containing protein [Mycobacteriales bacterium]
MLGEAALTRIAVIMVTAILKNPSVRNAALRKIGRHPVELAVKKALRAAYASLATEYPRWVDALFDESFLELEGAQCLADVVTRGRDATPTDLARRYAGSMRSTGDLTLVRDAEPAAAHLLAEFTRAIRAEPAVAEVLDSKALDSAAEDIAAIRAALDAGRATDGTLWDYLRWTIDRNLYLDPRGTFQTQRQVQLKLDRVYVSLDASRVADLNHRDRGEPATADALDPAMTIPRGGPEVVLSLHEAVAAHPRLVVLGNPGGGKTTLLRHLALRGAQRIWDGGLESIGDGARVPILVRVAEYADSDAWRRASLTDYLANYHRVADCPAGALADLFTRKLAAGHCLLLLDGLDEIAQTDERIAVVGRIEEFVRRHTRAGNAFVVTSREEGYRAAALGGGFTHVRARDMTRQQVEQFLRRWCRAVEDAETPDLPEPQRQAVADREIAGILAAVDDNPGVARLAVNPLILRVLALIHRTGAKLPQKRIELYKLAADTLTSTWRLAQGVRESALARPEHVTRLMPVLGHWMHLNRPSGIATEADVLNVLGEEWARINGLPWDPDDIPLAVETAVRAFLERVRIQTGLFVERAPDRYGFLHLTFEEYFAARALIAKPRTRTRMLREHLHDPRWTEPILLALGFVGLDYPDDAADLVEAAVLARGETAKDCGPTPTSLEEWLGRDFLFALRCLTDEIPVAASVVRGLITQAEKEMFSRTGRGAYSEYRRALAQLLSSMLNTTHGPALVAGILQLSNGEAANERLHWLAAVPGVTGLSHHPGVLARLLGLATDPDVGIRAQAAHALGYAADQPEVLPRLLELTTDPDPYVRGTAAHVLGPVTYQPEVLPRLLELTTDPESGVRLAARSALESVAYQTWMLTRLLELTTRPEPNAQEAAVSALSQVADRPEVLPRLLELTTNPEPDVQMAAVSALSQVADRPEVLPRLLELTTNPASFVRAQAASALGHAVTQPEARRRLEGLVENVGPDRIVEDLHRVIQSDAPNLLRGSALSALAFLCRWSPHVLDQVLDALRDNNRYVRAAAARNLIEVGQSSDEQRVAIREALLGMLTQPEPDGGDEDDPGSTADSAYKALWGLEVATADYRQSEVL